MSTANPNYDILPEHMRAGFRLWVEEGIQGGDFQRLILENDFVHAATAADSTNLRRLLDYIRFLYYEIPIDSWGSKEACASWHGANPTNKEEPDA